MRRKQFNPEKVSGGCGRRELSWPQASGPPVIRADNRGEFTAGVVRAWLKRIQVKPLSIEPGSRWENGSNESFNGKLPDELRNRELFYSLAEARYLIECWRRHYNQIRPRRSPGYRPPAPAATLP